MLPNILNPPKGMSLFPPSVYSNQVTLALPPPLPLNVREGGDNRKLSSCLSLRYRSHPSLCTPLPFHWQGTACTVRGAPVPGFDSLIPWPYAALYSDLDVEMNRFTVSQAPSTTQPLAVARRRSQASTNRQRHVRVLLTIYASPRLPPHQVRSPPFFFPHFALIVLSLQPTSWQTSSLFTFSPLSGLIKEHKVETIRPLPGEGVAEWLKNRLWGWRGQEGHMLGLPAHVGSVRSELDREAAMLRAKKREAR